MNWSKVLLEAADEVRVQVAALAGTKEAKLGLGIGAGGDVTKKIDKVAEDAIIEVLNRHKASCILVSEEAGIKAIGDKAEIYLIVDPLDGTNNAIRGIDFYATSLAVSDKPTLDGVFCGLIMDLQCGATFQAEKGKGAYRNGTKIKVSEEATFDSIIGLDLNGLDESLLIRISPLILTFCHLRHLGANALEICYVAAGLIDAFVDVRHRIRVTDIAAGYILLKEAGGDLFTIDGKEANMVLTPQSRGSIIAGNKKICQLILDTLNK